MEDGKKATGYNGLYLERGGVGIRSLAERLNKPPEIELTPEQKEEVFAFANTTIHDMPIVELESKDDEGKVLMKGLEQVLIDSTLSQGGMMFGAALVGERGQHIASQLQQEKDMHIDMPVLDTQEAAYKWLANAADEGRYDDLTFHAISKATLDRYKSIMTEALLSGDSVAPDELEMMHINFTPELTLNSAAELQVARKKLLLLRHNLGVSGEVIDGAKKAVVDVYLAKLNAAVAGNVDSLLTIYEQAELEGNDALATKAKELLGGFGHIVHKDDARVRTLTRLDYLRNGIGIDAEGKASPIASELERVAGRTETEDIEAYFTPEQVRVLKETPVSVERMQGGYQNVLREAGVLSSEDSSTWYPKRGKRAADEKFQVVVQPALSSFAVDGIDGVFMVSSKPKSLYDTIVVAGFHEAGHIDQCLSDDEFAKELKIGKLKGKRAGSLREPAANALQRMAERRLFGASKPVSSPTYTNALKVLRNGGSLADAARAFYIAKLHAMPETPLPKAAEEAADRVLRLMRHHGVNSQPLMYAEEGIMAWELDNAPADVAQRAGALTSLDLVDQLKLHTYGLLPNVAAVRHDWAGLVFKEFAPDIAQALQNAGLPMDQQLLVLGKQEDR